MAEIPIRETFWNIPLWAIVGVYVGGALALALFGWGVAILTLAILRSSKRLA